MNRLVRNIYRQCDEWEAKLPPSSDNDTNTTATVASLCNDIERALFVTLRQQTEQAIQLYAVPKHMEQAWRRLSAQWIKHTQQDLPHLRAQPDPLRLATIDQVDTFLGLLALLLPEVVDTHLDAQSLAVYDLFLRIWERTDVLLRYPTLDHSGQTNVHQRWAMECLAAFDPRGGESTIHALLRIPGAQNQAADSCQELVSRWHETRRVIASYIADACACATPEKHRTSNDDRARLQSHTLAEKRRALFVWVHSQEAHLRDTSVTHRLSNHVFLSKVLAQCRATFWQHVWRTSVMEAARQFRTIQSPCVPILRLWANATPSGGEWSLDLLSLALAWLDAAVAVLVYRPMIVATTTQDDAHDQLVARLTRLLEETSNVDVNHNFAALGLELLYVATTTSSPLSRPLLSDLSTELSTTLARLVPRTPLGPRHAVLPPPPNSHYASMLKLLGTE
jgi:hypothetical protein